MKRRNKVLKKLHNGELYNVYLSSNNVRVINSGATGTFNTYGEKKKCIQNFDQKASTENIIWEI
jgi:hypothetical protein